MRWYELRQTLSTADIQTMCVEIDKFWQQAPLINHYLHPRDVGNWPDPWTLMADNTYCEIARGLGMVYTLLLLDITDVDFCIATNDNSEDVAIVLVGDSKLVMNYWPNMVMDSKSEDFTITQKIDIYKIKKLMGNIR